MMSSSSPLPPETASATAGAISATAVEPEERPAPAGPHRLKKPDWFRVKLPTDPRFFQTDGLVKDLGLNTICESGRCPNRWECWSRATATFMVGGDRCTRNCGFCAVATLKPKPLEPDEPDRVAEATARLGLRHVVLTMVARDDLADGAAAHVAATLRAIREKCPGVILEVLTSDFRGNGESLQRVLDAKPDIFSHNLETVERLTPSVRSRATYRRSLDVLAESRQRAPEIPTKSGMMLGLGETDKEIEAALFDLRAVGCDILTLGQYLQPSPQHLPVVHWVTPERFNAWAARCRELGFRSVAAGPLVRSSYYADAVDLEALR